ncbi:hypothetical protein QBC44DRAFT_344511 [Cladorrhinum sp. PSN332]|nr:hypothetical protein QBC44DRAFT_344511 [Cladorrhinum sp. PSN332]
MAVFCCCASRTSKARASAQRDNHHVLPSPPPPARLPGPLTLNPVAPMSARTSPRSLSSLQPSMPAAIAPLEPVEFGELVVEDSDSEEDPEPYTHNKSTSTLQLVKTRIRRHLSQDSLTRRKARSAVGSSQEELQRRAELKRLMHKRIQEELRSEEGQESSQSEASSTHRHPTGLGIDNLPGGGPRDNIEFSVSEEESKSDTPPFGRPGSGINISHPSPDNDRLSIRSATQVELTGLRRLQERSSLPQVPDSPSLLPRRYPSTRATSSLGSWRLSYSAGQLDELLGYVDEGAPSRAPETLGNSTASPISSPPFSSPETLQPPSHTHSLSRSHSSPARHGTHESDTPSIAEQSPLGIWLRSQGLQSRSPSPARTSDQDFEQGTSVQQAEVVYLRRWSSVQNSAVPEADIQRPEIVHLYDMDIHRQLGTRTFNTPTDTPTRSRSERHSGATGSGAHPNRGIDVSESPSEPSSEMRDTPVSQIALAIQDPNGLPTQSSSVYPSAPTSGYLSQGTSALHLPAAVANPALPVAFSLPGFKWLDNSYNPHAQGSSESTSRQTIAENSVHRSSTPETTVRTRVTSPMPPSTSFGKLRRESPYGAVQKSIGYFHLGQGAPSLIVKRFYKEAEAPVPEPVKPSFLARLHLTLPRRAKLSPRAFDGTAPEIDPEEEPTSPSPSQVSIRGEPRPYSWGSGTNQTASYHPLTPILSEYEGSADDLWRAAVQDHAQNRPDAAKTTFHRRGSSFPEGLQKEQQDAGVESQYSRGSSGYTGLPSTDRSCLLSSTPVSPESYTTTDYGLTSIEEMTESPKDQSLHRVRPTVHDSIRVHIPTRRAASFPESPVSPVLQAPYSLYGNGVLAEDSHPSMADLPEFPMPPSGQNTESSSNNAEDTDQRTSKVGALSFPGRLGKAVKSGLSKLVPSRGLPHVNSSKSLQSHRKRIDNTNREPGCAGPQIVVPARVSSYSKPQTRRNASGRHVRSAASWQEAQHEQRQISLSARMATLLHIDGGSETEHRHVRGSTTTTTERFVTPMSSLYTSNNDTASFHSYPQSRSHSRVALGSADVLTEISTDIDSIKSDTARGPRHQLLNATPRGNMPESRAQFATRGRKSRTHPLLTVKSLDRMNRLAKESSSRSLEVQVV